MEFGNQELRSVQQWFMCIFACLWWFFKVRIDLFITVLNRLCRWGLKNGGLVGITLTYGEVSKLGWPSWKGGAKATLGCSQTQIKQPFCYALNGSLSNPCSVLPSYGFGSGCLRLPHLSCWENYIRLFVMTIFKRFSTMLITTD